MGFLIFILVLCCVIIVLTIIVKIWYEKHERVEAEKINARRNSDDYKKTKESQEHQSSVFWKDFLNEKQKMLGNNPMNVLLSTRKTKLFLVDDQVGVLDINRYFAKTIPDNTIVIYEERQPAFFVVHENDPREDFRAFPGEIKTIEKIRLSDVLFWSERGTLQYTSNVSGGGGGGLNTEGAIGGAVLGGTAGAIIGASIGSQTNPIKTETVKHDSREVVVRMNDGTQKTFPYSYYDAFMKVIPEKEYTFLQMSSNKNT